MVHKRSMSRYSKLPVTTFVSLFLAIGSLSAPYPAFAVEEAIRAEIVYRASFGRADDIKLLIDQGASPNQTNADGVPIISVASIRNDPESINVIKTLIELRGNINAVDPKGQNALFYAAKSGNVDALNILLAYGIDHRAFDANGDTARTIAIKADRKDVIAALEDFARNQNKKVNQIRRELQFKKEEQERAKIAKAAEIEKALNQVATTPAEIAATAPAVVAATSPAVIAATSPATVAATTPAEIAATTPATVAVPEEALTAITDKKSVVHAEEIIKDTSQNLDEASQDLTKEFRDDISDPEYANQMVEAAEKKSMLNAQLDAASEVDSTDQQKEFEAIIKNTIEPDPAPAPLVDDISATDTASIEKIIPSDKVELTPEEIAAKKAKEQAERQLKEEQRKQEIKNIAYDIALHTCAFQYWAYVMQVRQSSEFGSEELTISIQSNKDKVEALQKKLLVDYHMPASFYDNITKSAQLRIYNQLNRMPSNRMRHEYGVGKMDDMKTRCEEIARQWGFPAKLKTQQEINQGKHGKKHH